MLSPTLSQWNTVLTPSQRNNRQKENGSTSSRTASRGKRRSRSMCGSLHRGLSLIAYCDRDLLLFLNFELDIRRSAGLVFVNFVRREQDISRMYISKTGTTLEVFKMAKSRKVYKRSRPF